MLERWLSRTTVREMLAPEAHLRGVAVAVSHASSALASGIWRLSPSVDSHHKRSGQAGRHINQSQSRADVGL